MAWTASDIPDQSGRVAVVTGASSGIGEAAALALARKGAEVVLAVRNPARGETARQRILDRVPAAKLRVGVLDLERLASVREFAARMEGELPRIDILLNNAGLGQQPTRSVTADGFERQFGTNHLGHFALTGLLVPALKRAEAPRVVAIASIAHRRGQIQFDDLQWEKRYSGPSAYAQSKLANLMFALTLDRRARAADWKLASVAAHPGLSATNFIHNMERPGWQVRFAGVAIGLLGQDAANGALPGLYAATMADVSGGDYWGPDGFMEFRGPPKRAEIRPQAKDVVAQDRLWAESERLTGVAFRV